MVFRFSILAILTIFSVQASAEFKPVLKPKPKEWNVRLQDAGLELSLQEFATLKTYESMGVMERQTVAIDLPALAENSPEQASRWIKAAVPMIEDSNFKAKNNVSFERTRTGFLRALVADLAAEGRTAQKIFTVDRMVSDFNKYRGSPRAFYEVGAVYWAYAHLIDKGLVKPGPAGLQEAAIQYKISEYKSKFGIDELDPDEQADLHARLQWKFLHPERRKIASVNSTQKPAR